LVVIAIIGVLIAMLLPATQASRETARRAQCTNQLRQLILAMNDFEMAEQHFPAGSESPQGPIQNLPNGQHISWIARLLPYLDESARYSQLDLTQSAYHQRNDAMRQTSLEVLKCPSSRGWSTGVSEYAGSHHHAEAPIDVDNNGVLFLNIRVTRNDLRDGAAYTLFLGEKQTEATDLGWLSGTPATLRNVGSPPGRRFDPPLADPPWRRTARGTTAQPQTPAVARPTAQGTDPMATDDAAAANTGGRPPVEPDPVLPPEQPDENGIFPRSRLGGNPAAPLAVGGFGSDHVDGLYMAFGDGSVRFIGYDVHPGLLKRLANRGDGQIVDATEW
jgi:type II secretory pathway pseudopilin PulG